MTPEGAGAEERLLKLFEDHLAQFTPEEQERRVNAALAVPVRSKAPQSSHPALGGGCYCCDRCARDFEGPAFCRACLSIYGCGCPKAEGASKEGEGT